MKKTGHELLDEFESHVDRLHAQSEDRKQVVDARLVELEDEKHALHVLQQRVAATRSPA